MAVTPREIRLTEERRRLDVIWEDGTASRLTAATLRAHSRSAETVRAGIDGLPLPCRTTSRSPRSCRSVPTP